MRRNILAAILLGAGLLPTVALADVTMRGEVIPKIAVWDSNVGMADGGSNFGFLSSKKMSNGDTVKAEIEFLFDTSNGALSPSIGRTNIQFIGNWGSVVIGSQTSILHDVQQFTCWNTDQRCAAVYVGYQSRVADAIVLRIPTFDPVSLALQWELDGHDDLVAWSVGTGMLVRNIAFQAVYRDHYFDQFTQVAVGTILGDTKIASGFSSSHSGRHGWSAAASYSGIKITYDQITFDAGGHDWPAWSLDYDIDLGGSSMVLFLAQNEPDDTLFGIKWHYSF